MQAKTWPRAAGTAEATPQGKMMNPRHLGTGEAVITTANAKAKNKSVAVDPLATKIVGGSTTVNTTTTKMAANIAVEDTTARIAGNYQKTKTSALIGGGPQKGEETTTTIKESVTTKRKRQNSRIRSNCPKKPSSVLCEMPRKAVKRTAWKRTIARTTWTVLAKRHSTMRTCESVTVTIVTTVTPFNRCTRKEQ
jgi:hypothetical protein